MELTVTLISHTNSGKTTLSRTLLRRDVGVQEDREHVTVESTRYLWTSCEGHRLWLWDTPGLGSAPQLLQRIALQRGPVQWFLSQVWDRWKDPGLHFSQLALRTAVESSDLLLYTVNVSELPEAAGYVMMELSVLARTGKPILALLNYSGPPRSEAEGPDPDEQAWREQLRQCDAVKAVLPLDAFFRCWVQESVLLAQIETYIPSTKRAALQLLITAWQNERRTAHRQSMAVLGKLLAASAVDRETGPKESLVQRIGINRGSLDNAYTSAQQALLTRMEDRARAAVDELITLASLDGKSQFQSSVSATDFGQMLKVNESIWSAAGAALTGAAAGLAADIHGGGLTLGGGAIAGLLVGGASSWLLARGFNLARGEDESVRWTSAHFLAQAELALVTYLAVSHHGRGRGAWQESGHPRHWLTSTSRALEPERDALESLWKKGAKPDTTPDSLTTEATAIFQKAADRLLRHLYPEVKDHW